MAQAKKYSDFDRYLRSGPQPELTYMLSKLVLTAVEQLSAEYQPDPHQLTVALAVSRAVVEEIDTACREG